MKFQGILSLFLIENDKYMRFYGNFKKNLKNVSLSMILDTIVIEEFDRRKPV